MKWLEIIELRSVADKRMVVESHLQSLIVEAKLEMRPQTINLFCHSTVETDFSIHLHNESKGTEISVSPLGQRLANALKEFGLVNHSVWIEK